MADQPVVHIGENSPEQIAYNLLKHIADIEGKTLHPTKIGEKDIATRQWILDTYAECIATVRGFRHPG